VHWPCRPLRQHGKHRLHDTSQAQAHGRYRLHLADISQAQAAHGPDGPKSAAAQAVCNPVALAPSRSSPGPVGQVRLLYMHGWPPPWCQGAPGNLAVPGARPHCGLAATAPTCSHGSDSKDAQATAVVPLRAARKRAGRARIPRSDSGACSPAPGFELGSHPSLPARSVLPS